MPKHKLSKLKPILVFLLTYVLSAAPIAFSATIPAENQKKDVTQKQKEQLSTVGRHAQSGSGTLQNIPLGTSDPRAVAGEALVRKILNILAPEEVQKRQLMISIYSSPEPNAFAAERKWKGVPYVMGLYGFDSKKTVYEIGITLGLLDLLQTEDQLAFVLAHELNHLLEDHTYGAETQRELIAKWWEMQRYEAVVDHLALKMILGKYDLKAGLEALNIMAKRFAPEESQGAVSHGLNALLSTHHHEGVRIDMVQSYIEYLRRVDGRAQPRTPTPLSPIFKKTQNPRSPPWRESEERKAALRARIDLITKKIVSRHAPFSYGDGFVTRGTEAHPIKEGLIYPPRDMETQRELLEYAIEGVLRLKTSNQNKIDAILGFYRFTISDSYMMTDSFKRTHTREAAIYTATKLIGLMREGWDPSVTIDYINKGEHQTNSHSSSDEENPEFRIAELLDEARFATFLDSLSTLPYGSSFLHALTAYMLKSERNQFGNYMYLVYVLAEKTIGGTFGDKSDASTSTYKRLYEKLFLELMDAHDSFDIEKALDNAYKNSDQSSGSLVFFLSTADKLSQSWPDQPLTKIMSGYRKTIVEAISRDRQALAVRLESDILGEDTLKELGKQLVIREQVPFDEDFKLVIAKAMGRLAKTSIHENFDPFLLGYGIGDVIFDILISLVDVAQMSKQERVDILIFMSLLYKEATIHGAELRPKIEPFLDKLLYDFTAKDFIDAFDTPVSGVENLLEIKFFDPEYLKVKERVAAAVTKYKMKPDPGHVRINFIRAVHERMRDPTKPSEHALTMVMLKALEASHPIDDVIETRRSARLNILTFLSVYSDRQRLINQMSFQNIRDLVALFYREGQIAFDTALRVFEGLNPVTGGDRRSYLGGTGDRVAILLDAFVSKQEETQDLSDWANTFHKIMDLNKKSTGMELRPGYKQRIEQRFLELSQGQAFELAYSLVSHGTLIEVLSEDSLMPLLLEKTKRDMGTSKSAQKLKNVVDAINEELHLESKYPDIYVSYREQVAEVFRLQPHTVGKILPEKKRTVTTKSTKEFTNEVHGLSALVAATRTKTVDEQLEFIDYLMGRRKDIPPFIEKMAQESSLPLAEYGKSNQIRLQRQGLLERAFFVNAFLAGPTSILEKEEGVEKVLDYLMRDIESKTEARKIARALLKSQGDMQSVAVAYVLSQKAKENGKRLTEGEIIRSLFEAFGAGGIKLGQYLAFTNEMSRYQAALAELQDSALPVSYLEVVRLVKKRLGDNWDKRFEIVRVLGSGSVNIAIEIRNKETSETQVYSILRDEIETGSREDFRKLKAFVAELYAMDSVKYGFLPGLIGIIEQSVTLEFNKENAQRMQDAAARLYTFEKDGWSVRTPKTIGTLPGVLVMEKADGITARKLKTQNFELYKSAMSVVLERELEVLLGVPDKVMGIPVFANPDLHDGQVMIDIEKKAITVLDFGQALMISSAQRDIGIDFLRASSPKERGNTLRRTLERIGRAIGGTTEIDAETLRKIEARSDSMDRFIYILGTMSQKGWEIPLETIHWVLGINRAIQLGNQIGIDVRSQLHDLVITKKLGGSTDLYLDIRPLIQRVRNLSVKSVSACWDMLRKNK